jgi:hypothetical protein
MDKADIARFIRTVFKSAERQACVICGKYPSLTHAHHIIPVSEMASVIQRHNLNLLDVWNLPVLIVWLCPTHHAAWHAFHRHDNTIYGDLSREELVAFDQLSLDEQEAADAFISFVLGVVEANEARSR